MESGEKTLVSEGKNGIATFSWSPDSRWLAFAEVADNTFRQVKLYNMQTRERVDVTSDRVNSAYADWDPDGDFLYFLSDRNLVSLVSAPWGPRQPEPFFDKQWEVYHVSLRPGLRSPFAPDDELSSDDDADDEADEGEADEDAPITIETAGLARRVKRVPVPAGNYSGLETNGKALFFSGRDADREGGTRLEAVAITNDDPEIVTVADRVRRWELSGSGDHLLIQQGGDFAVVDARAAPAGSLADHRVDLSNWAFAMDVREDWREIYRDLWRQERDWFYDPNMHGVDWDGVYDKYMALVGRVTTRDELNDVIGRVVGELSALHTRVSGGGVRTGDDNVRVSSLGARIMRTAEGDRIDYIYQTDPDYPDEMSPLADPDLRIFEGDVITAVNGRSVLDAVDIGALLRNQTRPVRLRLRGGNGEAREVMVTPTTNERNIRYADWEYTRRVEVEEAAEGDIGYVHLRAMGGRNLTEWYRQFYPVFNRPGLILDVRRNSAETSTASSWRNSCGRHGCTSRTVRVGRGGTCNTRSVATWSSSSTRTPRLMAKCSRTVSADSASVRSSACGAGAERSGSRTTPGRVIPVWRGRLRPECSGRRGSGLSSRLALCPTWRSTTSPTPPSTERMHNSMLPFVTCSRRLLRIPGLYLSLRHIRIEGSNTAPRTMRDRAAEGRAAPERCAERGIPAGNRLFDERFQQATPCS